MGRSSRKRRGVSSSNGPGQRVDDPDGVAKKAKRGRPKRSAAQEEVADSRPSRPGPLAAVAVPVTVQTDIALATKSNKAKRGRPSGVPVREEETADSVPTLPGPSAAVAVPVTVHTDNAPETKSNKAKRGRPSGVPVREETADPVPSRPGPSAAVAVPVTVQTDNAPATKSNKAKRGRPSGVTVRDEERADPVPSRPGPSGAVAVPVTVQTDNAPETKSNKAKRGRGRPPRDPVREEETVDPVPPAPASATTNEVKPGRKRQPSARISAIQEATTDSVTVAVPMPSAVRTDNGPVKKSNKANRGRGRPPGVPVREQETAVHPPAPASATTNEVKPGRKRQPSARISARQEATTDSVTRPVVPTPQTTDGVANVSSTIAGTNVRPESVALAAALANVTPRMLSKSREFHYFKRHQLTNYLVQLLARNYVKKNFGIPNPLG